MDAASTILTVFRRSADPYRLDTPAGHRDGGQGAAQHVRLIRAHKAPSTGVPSSPAAIRKPYGAVYQKDDANWEWLAPCCQGGMQSWLRGANVVLATQIDRKAVAALEENAADYLDG